MTPRPIDRALVAAALLAVIAALPAAGRAAAAPCTLRLSGPAELLAPDVASTPNGEVRPALSPDGRTLLWGSTDRAGGPGGWDVWMSRRSGDARSWGEATPVSFDTGAKEFDPAFDPSGRWVYFFSDRSGGFGGDDLYRVPFDPATGRFGQAENLGPTVNTKGDEWAPAPLPGGRLLFATDGRPGRGRHDLYVAEEKGGKWRGARPLPGTVNTADDEFDATFLRDESILVFSRSEDVDEKPVLLYSACKGKSGYGEAALLPDGVNVPGGFTFGPAADPGDPDVLLFTGRRPEAQRGKLDLYRIRFDR
jgi:hypothetical protein